MENPTLSVRNKKWNGIKNGKINTVLERQRITNCDELELAKEKEVICCTVYYAYIMIISAVVKIGCLCYRGICVNRFLPKYKKCLASRYRYSSSHKLF